DPAARPSWARSLTVNPHAEGSADERCHHRVSQPGAAQPNRKCEKILDTTNLPVTALVHADRNQQRDVAHLATAFEHDAVEINIRVLALDRAIALGLNRPIDPSGIFKRLR